MSTPDLVIYIGYFISSWALGFGGGYLLTKFKDAVSQAV